MSKLASNQPPRLKALGSYIFAGGFTIGTEEHFEVQAHLEDGDYGCATFKMNRPHVPVFTSYDSWPTERYRGAIDYVYCNPPCAPFSVAGRSLTQGKDNWRTDPRTICWKRAFGLLGRIRPRAIAIESVTQAFTRAREMMDEFALEAINMGYSVTHLLVNARWHNTPQDRRRYFFVAHDGPLDLGGHNWPDPPNVGDILADVPEPGWYRPVSPALEELYRNTPHREGTRWVWEKLNPKDTWTYNVNGVSGRPRMTEYRLDPNSHMGTFIGDFVVHPSEPRRLGLEEAKALCCFPRDWRFAGNPNGAFSELARGVLPPVAEWLAGRVRRMIESGKQERCMVHLHDMRDPEDIHAFAPIHNPAPRQTVAAR